MGSLRFRGAIGVALFVAPPMCGCGSNAPSQPISVTAAATKTSESGTLRVAMTQSFRDAQSADVVQRTSGEATVDLPRHRSHFNGVAIGDNRGSTAGSVEIITNGEDRWTTQPVSTEPSKRWTHLPSKGGPAPLAGGAELEQLLRCPATDIRTKDEGQDTVRGVRTHRYLILVAAGATTTTNEAFGTSTTEGWVDGDGLLRRLRFTVDLKELGGAPRQEMEETLEYFDFGASFKISPPPPDEVSEGLNARSTLPSDRPPTGP